MSQDLYEILGVDRNATQSEIKSAFRKKAKQFHPDTNHSPDAEERMREINQAYEVLSDENKRAMYDRFGNDPSAANSNFTNFQSGTAGFEDIFSEFFSSSSGSSKSYFSSGGFDFSDIFSDFFGTSKEQNYRYDQRDNTDLNIYYEFEIPFLDSILGAKYYKNFKIRKKCYSCHGSGADSKEEDAISKCGECNGLGTTVQIKSTFLGRIQTKSVCPSCHGTGNIIIKPCATCSGNKFINIEENIEIEIPPNIESGETICIKYKGNESLNDIGNIYIGVYVSPSELFSKDGDNLYVEIKIDPLLAIVGGEVKVPTPYGIEKIKINPCTANGDRIVIKNCGIKSRGFLHKKHDLIGIVAYTKPKKYSSKELRELSCYVNSYDDEYEEYIKNAAKEISNV